MPFALALAGSLLIHLSVMLGVDLELPSLGHDEPPPAVVAILVPTKAETPVVKATAAPKPAPRTTSRPVATPVTAAPLVPSPTGAASPAPSFEPPALPAVEAASPPPPAPQAAPAPPPTLPFEAKGRMRYAVIRGEQGFVVGQATHEWEHGDGIYRLRSVTETTGLAAIFKPARVVQESQGRIVATGLAPLEFRHEKVNGVDSARFDWERGLLAYEGREVALPAGTQDMLSLYYQVALQARGEAVLELPIATGRKLEPYRFESLGEERLTLAGKEWRTWHYAAKSGADRLELWIAPELPGLPLKIRFVDRKGEIFDQIAEAVTREEKQ